MSPRGARVRSSPRFDKAIRKAEPRIAEAGIRAIKRLTEDRRHPGLNLERIEGELWSIRVTRNHRILLEREHDHEGEVFVATHLDTHDIYKQRR